MKRKLIIIIAIVLSLGVGLVVWQQDSSTEDNQSQSEDVIAVADVDPGVVTYNGETGIDAMSLLKNNADVVTEDSDFGEFVTSVNGIGDDSDGKYWLYYINDSPATQGATEYVTNDGDVIEWRYE